MKLFKTNLKNFKPKNLISPIGFQLKSFNNNLNFFHTIGFNKKSLYIPENKTKLIKIKQRNYVSKKLELKIPEIRPTTLNTGMISLKNTLELD